MNMESNVLLDFKKQVVELAEVHEEHIVEYLNSTKKEIYKRNDYFSTINDPSTSIAFIAKGLFRVYIIDREGNEATLNFRGENMPMSSYGAIFLNQIEPVYIQALEDSEVYTITRENFLKFWEDEPKIKEIIQKFTELDCLALRKREFSFLQDDAKTRYLNFLKDFEQYGDRIKLKYVASYLGITPEALSRIRSAPL
jgi:CRP-like cAMP-binding protein